MTDALPWCTSSLLERGPRARAVVPTRAGGSPEGLRGLILGMVPGEWCLCPCRGSRWVHKGCWGAGGCLSACFNSVNDALVLLRP